MSDDLLDAHLYTPLESNPWAGLREALFSNMAEPNQEPWSLDKAIENFKAIPFIPRGPDYQVVSPWLAANYERLIRKARHEMLQRLSKHHHVRRWQKIRKRQRRAQHRKHCVGRTYRK